jgi:ribosomal protein L6P/L9E
MSRIGKKAIEIPKGVEVAINDRNINIKGKLETSLNMGFFNVNECIPIDITFCNKDNKNIVIK